MTVEIDRIIRAKRRTLTLIVEDDGSLVIRAPLRIPEKTIHEFVESHTHWIEKKQEQARNVVKEQAKQFLPGESFLFLGQSYNLELVKGQRKPLILDGCFKLAERSHVNAKKVFQEWYRDQARQVINEHAIMLSSRYGFHYNQIRISSARTRWGSCSPSGSLSFSWRLILNPIEVVDYVIIHELVHTVVLNHSKRYWKMVEKILPDYMVHNKWLRKNGQAGML